MHSFNSHKNPNNSHIMHTLIMDTKGRYVSYFPHSTLMYIQHTQFICDVLCIQCMGQLFICCKEDANSHAAGQISNVHWSTSLTHNIISTSHMQSTHTYYYTHTQAHARSRVRKNTIMQYVIGSIYPTTFGTSLELLMQPVCPRSGSNCSRTPWGSIPAWNGDCGE